MLGEHDPLQYRYPTSCNMTSLEGFECGDPEQGERRSGGRATVRESPLNAPVHRSIGHRRARRACRYDLPRSVCSMLRAGPERVVCRPEKRKVGSSTLPLTTSFGPVSSALTSAIADLVLSRLQPPSDHDCPCVTVVGRPLSHADRTSCLRAPGSRSLCPRRPSVFQAGHIPSWRGSYESYALSPVADDSGWLLLLLSPLLSAVDAVLHFRGLPADGSVAPWSWSPSPGPFPATRPRPVLSQAPLPRTR